MLLSNCWLWHIKPVERISSMWLDQEEGEMERERNWSEIIKEETIGKANTKKNFPSLSLPFSFPSLYLINMHTELLKISQDALVLTTGFSLQSFKLQTGLLMLNLKY